MISRPLWKKLLLCAVVIYFYLNLYYVAKHVIVQNKHKTRKIYEFHNTVVPTPKISLKYILLWSPAEYIPFRYMGKGQTVFKEKKCKYTNCYVTSDRLFFDGDYTKFDVIAFHGPDIYRDPYDLPAERSPHQKYVFASIESPQNYPLCSTSFNNFFNWTWTYKLDSDVRWGYMVIRDANNTVIGPNKNINWMKVIDMDDVPKALKKKIKRKKKAVAIFLSNCLTSNGREDIIEDLKIELGYYHHKLDVYGDCGDLICPQKNEKKCNAMIANTYYFYLSFENSCREDYVTEKLLRALNNDAVPIVYGTKNYSRFMPDGIYLNVDNYSQQKLAAKIDYLIHNPEKYLEYFKWKNHYSYHDMSESPDTDEYCKFCEILNDEDKVRKTTVYNNFLQWWSKDEDCTPIDMGDRYNSLDYDLTKSLL